MVKGLGNYSIGIRKYCLILKKLARSCRMLVGLKSLLRIGLSQCIEEEYLSQEILKYMPIGPNILKVKPNLEIINDYYKYYYYIRSFYTIYYLIIIIDLFDKISKFFLNIL